MGFIGTDLEFSFGHVEFEMNSRYSSGEKCLLSTYFVPGSVPSKLERLISSKSSLLSE